MLVQRVVSGRRRSLWAALLVLIGIVLIFFALRLAVDVPNIATGQLPPPEAFERRYALHPVPAYVHIVPGVIYLVGAPFQLWRGFRTGHLTRHRRLGRALLSAGLVAGALAIVVGVWFPYGGAIEATAAVVFGVYFLAALVLALLAIRNRDVAAHRRWMIRAFAVAVGVGTIRIWVGLFQGVGLLAIQDNSGTEWFGIAFWVAFVLHAAAAEVYLAARPTAAGRTIAPVRGGR